MSMLSRFKSVIAQTSDAPIGLEIDSAEGIYLKTSGGDRFIDFISGIAVSSLGHRRTFLSAGHKKKFHVRILL